MKRINKDITKGLIIGFMFCFILTTLAPVAAAKINEIKVVMGGIKISIDGDIQVPTDGNGKVVEPMIYDGTTYLPVRALTNMLTDKKVDWDAKTQTVFIGKKPNSGETSVLLETLKPLTLDSIKIVTEKDAQFNLLDEIQSPFNRMKYEPAQYYKAMTYTRSSAVYKINSDYSTINGYFVEPYTYLGSDSKATIQFYSVDQYGEKTLIESYDTKAGDEPMKISVPVHGVNILRIEMAKNDNSKHHGGTFYNVTFTTAK